MVGEVDAEESREVGTVYARWGDVAGEGGDDIAKV
jgi:hypothetical protein